MYGREYHHNVELMDQMVSWTVSSMCRLNCMVAMSFQCFQLAWKCSLINRHMGYMQSIRLMGIWCTAHCDIHTYSHSKRADQVDDMLNGYHSPSLTICFSPMDNVTALSIIIIIVLSASHFNFDTIGLDTPTRHWYFQVQQTSGPLKR